MTNWQKELINNIADCAHDHNDTDIALDKADAARDAWVAALNKADAASRDYGATSRDYDAASRAYEAAYADWDLYLRVLW